MKCSHCQMRLIPKWAFCFELVSPRDSLLQKQLFELFLLLSHQVQRRIWPKPIVIRQLNMRLTGSCLAFVMLTVSIFTATITKAVTTIGGCRDFYNNVVLQICYKMKSTLFVILLFMALNSSSITKVAIKIQL